MKRTLSLILAGTLSLILAGWGLSQVPASLVKSGIIIGHTAAQGGGGFPLTVIQEATFQSGAGNTSSFAVTFPSALQSSGATAFMLVSGDGSASVGTPAGWTVDFNQIQATYARLILLHEASNGDTSATFTASNSSFAAYFFEVSGSHALNQSSTGGINNAASVVLPAIVPSAGSLVFGAVAMVLQPSENFATGMPPSMLPTWKTINASAQTGAGARALGVHIQTVGAVNASTVPPVASLPFILFSGGGLAYATFSIL